MARILRRLMIDSVDSVDRGAGEGCRVILTKRHKEADMSKSSRCPSCGQKLPDEPRMTMPTSASATIPRRSRRLR